MNRKQVLFLDGIRVSVQMADTTFARLQSTLLALGLDRIADDQKHHALILAVQDAWSIVDAVYRLRCLLQQLPGLKQNAPTIRLFYDRTRSIEELRHVVQHLNQQIELLASTADPIWGRLSWLAVKDPATLLISSCTIVMGSLFDSTHPCINPAGRSQVHLVDDITLSSAGQSIVLEPVMEQVAAVVAHIEPKLARVAADVPRMASDAMVGMVIQMVPDDVASSQDVNSPPVRPRDDVSVRLHSLPSPED